VTASGWEAAARAEVARWIAELRAARVSGGYPQQRLAEVLGVAETTVRSWESGRRIPTLINLINSGRELGLRLAIVGSDGRVRSSRMAAKPGELWEHAEIRSLAVALRGKRRDDGITQDGLAVTIGVSTWSVAQYERSRLHPRPTVFAAWAGALGCAVRWRALV
jgi:transcriptional regulator with XRE-family HTH domain